MDKRERKDMKTDAFVEQTMSVFERIEQNPRPWIMGAIAVAIVAVVVVAGWQISVIGGERQAARLAEGHAALRAAVVDEETPEPERTWQPTFESAERRAAAAAERLDEASGDVANLLRGRALLEAGEFEKAAEVLEEASRGLRRDPTLGGPSRAAYAGALEYLGRDEEALEIYRALASEERVDYPKDVALAEAARVLEELGRLEEAREAWRQITEMIEPTPFGARAQSELARLDEELAGSTSAASGDAPAQEADDASS